METNPETHTQNETVPLAQRAGSIAVGAVGGEALDWEHLVTSCGD